jgi:chromosome segregation ATPase
MSIWSAGSLMAEYLTRPSNYGFYASRYAERMNQIWEERYFKLFAAALEKVLETSPRDEVSFRSEAPVLHAYKDHHSELLLKHQMLVAHQNSDDAAQQTKAKLIEKATAKFRGDVDKLSVSFIARNGPSEEAKSFLNTYDQKENISTEQLAANLATAIHAANRSLSIELTKRTGEIRDIEKEIADYNKVFSEQRKLLNNEPYKKEKESIDKQIDKLKGSQIDEICVSVAEAANQKNWVSKHELQKLQDRLVLEIKESDNDKIRSTKEEILLETKKYLETEIAKQDPSIRALSKELKDTEDKLNNLKQRKATIENHENDIYNKATIIAPKSMEAKTRLEAHKAELAELESKLRENQKHIEHDEGHIMGIEDVRSRCAEIESDGVKALDPAQQKYVEDLESYTDWVGEIRGKLQKSDSQALRAAAF